jgi:hypothetical protein
MNNISGRRRFKNEINLIKNSYSIIIDSEIKFHVLLPNIGKITFEISSCYPFKIPIILINGEKYESFLLLKSNKLRSIYNKLYNNKCCMLCSSYICSSNWYPGIKIENILNEIIKMKNIMIKCNKYYLLEEIKQKNKIPIEINILSYLDV